MTPEEFTKGIEANTEELFFDVSAEAHRLFKSGAIDPEDYENNAVLPKLILYVALRNIAAQYKPTHTKAHDKTIKNLERF
jgi:hypothetical protein